MATLQKNTSFRPVQISVIIATYGRPQLASQLAQQIKKETEAINYEIIIIYQGSQAKQTEDNENGVKSIYLDSKNLCAARNTGMKQACAPIVLFFDDDITIAANTIEAHLRCYDDPKTVAVGGRVLNDGEIIPDNTFVEAGRLDRFALSFVQHFWSTKKQLISFPYGCNMSYRKDILVKTGGFDERIPSPLSAFEEIDAALKVGLYGRIVFAPEALVFHHKYPVGGTRMTPKEKMKMFYLCYGYFISKHIPFPAICISILRKSVTIIKTAPYALFNFYRGLLQIF